VLNVRFIGDAAIDSDNKGTARALEEFVRNIIVRRGDAAMAPGAILPLTPQAA
jgi:hypothetical protein